MGPMKTIRGKNPPQMSGPAVKDKLRTMRKKKVGMTGIEPALLAELDPKSSASASFATSPGIPNHTISRLTWVKFPSISSPMPGWQRGPLLGVRGEDAKTEV